MNYHDSDCATNSEPAYPAGKCDCDFENILTVMFRGLSPDKKREIINSSEAIKLSHNDVFDERKRLIKIADELQDTCHKQAKRIAKLSDSASNMVAELETYLTQYPGMAKGYLLDALDELKEAIK